MPRVSRKKPWQNRITGVKDLFYSGLVGAEDKDSMTVSSGVLQVMECKRTAIPKSYLPKSLKFELWSIT